MICNYFVSALLLLSYVSATFISNDTVVHMNLNHNKNGTIIGKEVLHFVLRDPAVQSGLAAVYSFTLVSNQGAYGSRLGKVNYHCGELSWEVFLDNNIPTQRSSKKHACEEAAMYIDLTNEMDYNVTYNIVVASSEYPMYNVIDNTVISGVVPGYSEDELVTFGAYIGESAHSGSSVDAINITIYSDIFSASTIRAFVSQYSTAQEIRPLYLTQDGNKLYASMSRSHYLFCMVCTRYIHVRTDTVGNEAVHFSLDFHVDRGIKELEMNKEYRDSVMPDIHENQMIVDFRTYEFDYNWEIVVQKLDQPSIPLYLEFSHTSFDDSEWDVGKTVVLNSLNVTTVTISQLDPMFEVGGVFYLHLRSDISVEEECQFSIVYHVLPSGIPYLYDDIVLTHTSKNTGVAIAYYKLFIPSEEFQDFKAVTISLQHIVYTWDYDPSYCHGFDLYLGEAKTRIVINPKDNSSYSHHASLSARNDFSVTITENEPGWCNNCIFGIAIRTTNMTSWVITSNLNYVVIPLQPNVPRNGSIFPFTGGIHTSFYLHQTEYRPISFRASRIKSADKHIQLFVSLVEPATIQNHSWMDSTVGDDLALITISNDHPLFCTDCYYYIGVYSLEEEEEDHNVDVEIVAECPDGVCLGCDIGFDPATNCQDCLPGYFGSDCKACKACAHGSCDSGKQGSGKCICEEGWGPDDVCNECAAGYWGMQCSACPDCNAHGQCSDGIDGTGECACEGNWDPRVNCEDCLAGFWGAECTGECPRNEEGKICSGHGKCNDKDFGNGRCTCEEGMVGIKCDTKREDDKCSPSCSDLHGACDEEKGVCVCYDGYTGKTCEKTQNKIIIVIGMLVIILILIASLFYIFKITRNAKGKKRKAQDVLLEGVE